MLASTLFATAGCKEKVYPTYRENPSPKAALPIMIRVTDAPVDVPVPRVFVQYEIDQLCLPPVSNYEGVQYEPKRHRVEYPVQRISETEFRSVVFEDAMEVADYYGRGPCRWSMSFIEASFPFVIDDRRIGASAATTHDELASQGAETIYIKKALTPLSSNHPWTSTWSSEGFQNRRDLLRENFFTVEISKRIEGDTK